MSDEGAGRKPARSTIRVRVEVTDREEGSFTDVTVAETELAEGVMQSATGDRYEPVLPTIEAVTREAVNKTLAQVVAYESVMAAREGAQS